MKWNAIIFLISSLKLLKCVKHCHSSFYIDDTTKVTIRYRCKFDHLKEGQDYITISCIADCNPECSYQFYRDEQLVHRVDRTISVLAGRNMSGRYTCSAKNSVMKTYKISSNFVDINVKCMFESVFCYVKSNMCLFSVMLVYIL